MELVVAIKVETDHDDPKAEVITALKEITARLEADGFPLRPDVYQSENPRWVAGTHAYKFERGIDADGHRLGANLPSPF